MKRTLETTEEFLTLPEEAIVQVIVTEIKERDVPGRDGKDGWKKLSFQFKILELPSYLEQEYAPLIGSTIFGSVGARFTTHPDNKLRQWAEALLGFALDEPGFELDDDMLVGRKARGVVGTYMKKDSTITNHQIKGLLALAPATTSGPTFAASTTSPVFAGLSDDPPF